MRVVLVALLLAASFSGCLAGEFDAVRHLQARADGALPTDCDRSGTTEDEFFGQARAALTHVQVRFDGDTQALPLDDAGDVLQEAFGVLYGADVNERLARYAATDELAASDYVGVSFSGSEGVWLPNMYDGCGQPSGERVFLVFGDGVIFACDAELTCGHNHSKQPFDDLQAVASEAHEAAAAR